MISPKIFQNSYELTEDLKKKAESFPLIARLYLPIIHKHAKKYPAFTDFDDWLCILYFHYIWYSKDDSWRLQCKQILFDAENNLNRLHAALGEAQFEILCQDLLTMAMHPNIEGVHNQLLAFYGELRGILYFANAGYKITRIQREDGMKGKTPDFRAVRDEDVAIVECKFILASGPERTFIKRYTWFLHNCYGIKNVPALYNFVYSSSPKELNSNNIADIKKFLNTIVAGEVITDLTLDRNYRVNINYEQEKTIGGYPVTIETQVMHLEEKFTAFLFQYILRRVMQLTPQLKLYSQENERLCAYIFIELDPEYNAPWKDLEQAKSRVLDYFEKNHGFSIDVVLETFPTISSL